MSLLQKLTPWRSKADPYWNGFINRPVSDPAHDIAAAIRGAHEGRVFPVKNNVPPPQRMANDLAELAHFLGAARLGIVGTDRSYLQSATDHGGGIPEDMEAFVQAHPFLIVFAVPAEYDPTVARGMAGQLPVQKAASLAFSLAAYLRELGYRGTVRPMDPISTALAAGLGTVEKGGRLSVAGHGTSVHIGDAVLTDLPLATGSPDL